MSNSVKSHTTHKPKQETPMTQDASAQEPSKKMSHNAKLTSDESSGGLVLIDKIFEPLQAALDAYTNILAAQQDLPQKVKEYPNPR